MKAAGAVTPPALTVKPLVLLKTTPVSGPPGTRTTRGTIAGVEPLTPPVYSVDRPVPLMWRCLRIHSA